jgi:hypothetical protein
MSVLEKMVSRLDIIASSVTVTGGQHASRQVERICDNLSKVASALYEGIERSNDLNLMGVTVGAKEIAGRLSGMHSRCTALLRSLSDLLAEIKVTRLTFLTEGRFNRIISDERSAS